MTSDCLLENKVILLVDDEPDVLGGGKSAWEKLFDKLGSFFSKRFGADWKERDAFFKAFEKEFKSAEIESSKPV